MGNGSVAEDGGDGLAVGHVVGLDDEEPAVIAHGVDGGDAEEVAVPGPLLVVELHLAGLGIEGAPALGIGGHEQPLDALENSSRDDLGDVVGGAVGLVHLQVVVDAAGVLLGLAEQRLDDVPGAPVELGRGEPVGLHGDAAVGEAGVGVGLTVAGEHEVVGDRDEGGVVAGQEVGDAGVEAVEVAQDLLLGVVLAGDAVAVEDGVAPLVEGGLGGDEVLEAHLRVLPSEELDNALRHLLAAVEVDGSDTVAGTLEEAGLVLAEGEDVEPAVVAEDTEEGLQVEAVADHHHGIEVERQAVLPGQALGEEDGQAVALLLPEELVVDEGPRRAEEIPGLGPAHAALDELVLGAAEEVLEADRVLQDVVAGGVGGQVDGDVPAVVRLGEGFELSA